MLPSVVRFLLLSLILAVPARGLAAQSPAPTDSAARHRAAAERLIEVSGLAELLDDQGDIMIAQQMEAMPELVPFEDILRDFYREQTSFTAIGPDMIELYVATFSEGELDEITEFYRTDLGRRMLAKLPELMTRVNAYTQHRIQAAMPKLVAALEARAAELEAAGTPIGEPAGPPEESRLR